MEEPNSNLQIDESDTIEKDKVILNRSWSFWENYETKTSKSYVVKEIYTFDDLISFWQFWNKYPGNETKKIFYNGECIKYFFKEKYRISAINLFEKGIRPEWEDEKNSGGNILTLEYGAKEFEDSIFSILTESWVKLMCYIIGEALPYNKYINGIRFVDKSKLGKFTSFRFEIWVNKNMKDNEIDELKKYLYPEFKCMATVKPIK